MAKQVYRLITPRLRVQRGSGNEDLVVERPKVTQGKGSKNERTIFKDSDEEPTLVEFDELCQVDVDFLLKIGAIAPYAKPAKAQGEEKQADA